MKTLYTSLLFFLFHFSVLAQIPAYEGGNKPQSFQPPQLITDKFKTEFPDIVPVWHVEERYYIADFADTSSFKGMSIAYDKNGRIMRRESEVENSTYPPAIASYYVKNYPGEKFRTWKSTDEHGAQKYCIKRANGTLWFDTEGNYVDPEKKNEQTAAAN